MENKVKLQKKEIKSPYVRGAFIRYLQNSTTHELKFDWLYPFVLSLFVFLLIILAKGSLGQFVSAISSINDISVTIIAILAGFNTASLAIVASTNKNIFMKSLTSLKSDDTHKDQLDLKDDFADRTTNPKKSLYKRFTNIIINNKTSNNLDTTLTFFSYAVISQLTILILGITSSMLLNLSELFGRFLIKINVDLLIFILSVYGVLWLTLVLHVIFISIRNVDMIYHFIMYKEEHQND